MDNPEAVISSLHILSGDEIAARDLPAQVHWKNVMSRIQEWLR
jgi:hypothetical protein